MRRVSQLNALFDRGWVLTILISVYIVVAQFTHFSLSIDYDNYLPEERLNFTVATLREVAQSILTAYMMLLLIRDRSLRFRGFPGVALSLLGLFAFASIFLNINVYGVSHIFGAFRILMLAVCSILLAWVAARGLISFRHLSFVLKFSVFVQLVISVFQLGLMEPFFGSSQLGVRVFGAFASPIHLSIFFGATSIYFASAIQRNALFWLALCLFGSLLTGGRTGLLLVFVGFGLFAYRRLDLRLMGSICALIVFSLLFGVVYYGVSDPLVSGREGTALGVSGEQRWVTWANTLEGLLTNRTSFPTALFGEGVGQGSNTFVRLVEWGGDGNRQGVISDSLYVYSVKSIGIAGSLVFLVALFFNGRPFKAENLFGLVGWALLGVTQIAFEIHPSSVILLSCASVPLRRERLGFKNQAQHD